MVVGSFVEGSGSFEGVPVQSFGGYDSFIAKLTSTGGVEWASSIGGSGENLPDYILGVDVDVNDNVLITGTFESEKLFIGAFTIDRKTISENYFVAKFNSAGQALWAKGTGLNVNVSGYDVKVGMDGNIYVLGRFYSGMITVDGFTLTSTGDADVMLIKYSSDGNAIAAINFGGTDFDSGTKLDVDPFGNLVATGYYYSVSFTIGPFTELKAESSSDLFVIKFNTDLNALCFSRVSGNAEVSLQSLDVDRAGNIWISVQNMFGFGEVVLNTDYVVESDVHTMIASISDIDDFDAGMPIIEFDVELGEGEEICAGDDAMLDAGEWCNAIITWQDGSHNRFYEVLYPGEYWVEVEINGLVARDTIVFLPLFPEHLDLGKDTTLCVGQSLVLDAGDYCGITYEWQNGSTSSTFLVTQPGLYSVLITNGTNEMSDAINVSYYPVPEINLGEDKMICEGELIAFNVAQPFPSQYLWSDGSTLPTLTIDKEGTFWVKVNTICQAEYDTIAVTMPGQILLDLGIDRTICSGNSVTLGGEVANAISYVWQDGTTDAELNVTSSGNFSVRVSNGCIEKADSVHVRVVDQENLTIPNVITPNDDEVNDIFVVPEELKGSQLQIYNRWGEDIYYNSSYQNTWTGEGQSAGVYYYTLHGVCPMAIKGIIHLLKH
jgi:gliding motility-associated-like protein